MANCPCICSDLDCAAVLTCVNDDLLVIQVGEENPVLENFCSAVIKCVDDQFSLINAGESTSFNYFGAALVKILESVSGFSGSGDLTFSAQDGVIQWLPASVAGQTYVDSGTGITVTGNGTSGNPYEPNLITSYARGLLSANNGLTYTSASGLFQLGGTLVANTRITVPSPNYLEIDLAGTGFFNFAETFTQFYLSGASGDAYQDFVINPNETRVQIGVGGTTAGADIYVDQDLGATGNSEINLNAFRNAVYEQDIFINQNGIELKITTAGTIKFNDLSLAAANNGYVWTLVDDTTGEGEWAVPPAAVSYSNEEAQDAVGTILVDSSTIAFTYSDVTPSITASVVDDSITFAKIQNITTDRLLGRDTAGSGNAEELTVGGGVEFTGTGIQTSAFTGDVTKAAGGTVTTIANDAVTDAKLRDSAGFSVIGKATTGTGDPADIAAGTDTVLGRVGSGDVAFTQVATGQIADDAVTFAKFQNINTSKVLGRTTGGGGNVEELSIGSNLTLSAGVLNARGRTLIGISVFTADDTWNKPTGCNAVIVLTLGAGGGGGGSAVSAASETIVASGGGAGAFAVDYITTGLGSSETVTVGVGGAGGVVGTSYVGSQGGTTSFGAHTSCEGGLGGRTMTSGTTPFMSNGGAGGFAVTGGSVYKITGQTGANGIRLAYGAITADNTYAAPGLGGVSPLGGGNQDYGNGGLGASSVNGSAVAEQAGGDGIVIVYEYS